MANYTTTFAKSNTVFPPQVSSETTRVQVSTEKMKNESKNGSKSESSKKAMIAKVALGGIFLLGVSYSIHRQFLQQTEALAAMKEACQKHHEERIQQCMTFHQWCATREAPKNMKGFPENYPEYARLHAALASNHPKATSQQQFMDASPMIACLNYKAFVNTGSPGVAKESGIKLHDDIHPHMTESVPDSDLREHCMLTTPNYCPA